MSKDLQPPEHSVGRWEEVGSPVGGGVAGTRTGQEMDRVDARGAGEGSVPAGALWIASGLLLMAVALQPWL